MSVYATIQGEAKFTDRQKFHDVIKWLSCMRKWSCRPIGRDDGEVDIDEDDLTIRIPLGCYRNLVGFLFEIRKKSETCYIVWTSTDGNFEGGVIAKEYGETVDKQVDLTEWATNPNHLILAPDNTDFSEENLQKYCDWQLEVENEFHAANT